MKAYTIEKLKPLIQKYQRSLTLEDVAVIIELDKIAARIEKSVEAAKLKDYFRIGSRWYQQITFARESLIRRIVDSYGDTFYMIGVLYALDTELGSDELHKTPSRLKLIAYSMKVDVPHREVTRILEKELGLEDDDSSSQPNGKSGEPFNPHYIAAFLAAEVGGDVDEWMDAPKSKIEGAMAYLEEKQKSEMKAIGKAFSGPPKGTDALVAIKEFKEKTNQLEEAWAKTSM